MFTLGCRKIRLKSPIIVKELAERIGVSPYQLIYDLMDMGHFAASSWSIKPEVASAICKQHGFDLVIL
jgi:translation initiation factor IF-2